MHARSSAPATIAGTARNHYWRYPAPLVRDYLKVTLAAWTILVVIVIAIAATLDAFGHLNGSIWDNATQVPAWYAGGIAGYVAWQTVPMMVANGRTRRDAGIEAGLFALTTSMAITILITIGFLIEHVVFRITGWPPTIDEMHFFTSQTDLGPMVVEYTLLYTGWSTVGMMVGLAFYRYDDIGRWLILLPASILIGIIDLFTSGPSGMVLDQFYTLPNATLFTATLATLTCSLIALAIAWRMLRALPIRNR